MDLAKPRCRSALTISSASNTRIPLTRSISGLSGGSVSWRRTEVISAIRPPGASTRAISPRPAKRLVEEMQGGEAAEASNEASRKGSRTALPRTSARLVGRTWLEVGGAALEHRTRRVDSDDQPRVADGARELAREVARPAGDVEHDVAGGEPHQQAGDADLLVHPGPGDALCDAPERRPPVVLVDLRDDAVSIRSCVGPVDGRSSLDQVEVAGPAARDRRAVLGVLGLEQSLGPARGRRRRSQSRPTEYALGPSPRGSPLWRARSSRRGISRSASTRGRDDRRASGATRRRIRLRI